MAKTFSPALLSAQAEKLASIGISKEFINLDELDATMEVLRQLKKGGKAELAEQAKAQKEADTAKAFENGKNIIKSAKIDDLVRVICGSGKFAKEYVFPIQKIGENTITVEFTSDNSPNGTTGKRYINYAKVVGLVEE